MFRLVSCILGKGRSPEKAGWLDRTHIPPFMEISGHYKVVDGPKHSGSAPFHSDEFYIYGVRDIYKGGPVFYFECPFPNLPEKFWVRKIIAAYAYYHFISVDDEDAMEPRYPSPQC